MVGSAVGAGFSSSFFFKRKTFYKTIETIGAVQTQAGWSADDKNWSALAETAVLRQARERGKQISDDALAR